MFHAIVVLITKTGFIKCKLFLGEKEVHSDYVSSLFVIHMVRNSLVTGLSVKKKTVILSRGKMQAKNLLN